MQKNEKQRKMKGNIKEERPQRGLSSWENCLHGKKLICRVELSEPELELEPVQEPELEPEPAQELEPELEPGLPLVSEPPPSSGNQQ